MRIPTTRRIRTPTTVTTIPTIFPTEDDFTGAGSELLVIFGAEVELSEADDEPVVRELEVLGAVDEACNAFGVARLGPLGFGIAIVGEANGYVTVNVAKAVVTPVTVKSKLTPSPALKKLAKAQFTEPPIPNVQVWTMPSTKSAEFGAWEYQNPLESSIRIPNRQNLNSRYIIITAK